MGACVLLLLKSIRASAVRGSDVVRDVPQKVCQDLCQDVRQDVEWRSCLQGDCLSLVALELALCVVELAIACSSCELCVCLGDQAFQTHLVCPLRCGDQAMCWCDVLVGICIMCLVLTYSVTYLVKYSVTYLVKYMVMYLPRGGRLKP
ncbi:hypothetical protein IGI04_010358 [Brassica rapa subsp. trilocularis]|uniref:Uncharacterized protein n=1 Tax=Brassica rapa subsp. trilocularis TaxID=1813537 RepID=A0ABQ7MZZ3_BRACM|nr:hypothetical protein IGI04_010358 [Brassica rapa subsp. trilocularis]